MLSIRTATAAMALRRVVRVLRAGVAQQAHLLPFDLSAVAQCAAGSDPALSADEGIRATGLGGCEGVQTGH
jgi:hypothetical protein